MTNEQYTVIMYTCLQDSKQTEYHEAMIEKRNGQQPFREPMGGANRQGERIRCHSGVFLIEDTYR